MPPVNRLNDSEKWALLTQEGRDESSKAAETGSPLDLGVSYMAEVVGQLQSDAAADVLRKLPKDFSGLVVAALPPDASAGLREILDYPSGVAGAVMAKEYLSIPQGMTLGEAVDYLQAIPPRQKGRIPYVYVLDGARRPVGVLQTRDLLFHAPETPVADLTASPVVSVHRLASQSELVQVFQEQRFMAVPLVDGDGSMTGVVAAGNVLQSVREEADRAIAALIGTDAQENKTQSVFRILRYRLPWLSVNIVSGLICAFISGVFNLGVEVMTTLLLFVPVVIGLSESTGIQGATIAVRNMSLNRNPFKDFGKLFLREVSVGLLIGTVCAVAVGLATLAWKGDATIALAIGLSVNVAVTVSAAVGLLLPVLFRAIRIDPASASGPLVLAIADIQTLLIYFNLVGFILRLKG